jgi:hypothetical protein
MGLTKNNKADADPKEAARVRHVHATKPGLPMPDLTPDET